ncbi:hypothetical protein BDZ94DRAFT_1212744 [Collybia nuda]|uniref:F-box domain-containing protein n=1 Tax=Collybia nuda TaxID=64659 RepID=A0A9P5YDP7_9AGAR|nr:hypothetical protein BDZ94DRAFT_1212744 [Collybia nuda]
MSDPFPTEIWLHLSQFLPSDSLQGMMEVNRIFFEMAMDARYKEISFMSFNPSEAKMLERLADPLIACRVRRLHLRLSLNRALFRRQPRTTPGIFRRRVKAALQTARLIRPDTTDNSAESSNVDSKIRTLTSFQDFYETLAIVFPGMSNLEEFTFNSWNWPTDFDIQPFFLAAWSTFGKSIRKLSLGGNLDGYRKLIVSGPSFDTLQELELEFTDNLHGSNSITDARILLESVAPFVTSLATRLISLKLWSWSSTDLSSFFKQLGPLPALRHLGIRAAFNRSLNDDPSGLARLLSDSSSTLQQLELRLDLAGLVNQSSEHPLAEWLSQTIVDHPTISTGLQTLEIYPTGTTRGFETLLICIQRSVSTLTKLVVRNRYLQLGETETIIRLISSHKNTTLTRLRLNVLILNADLFDLMGASLPGLKYLTLNIGDVADGDLIDRHQIFKSSIRSRSFQDWKLYDIDIWQGGSQLDGSVMLSIAESIPSIRSFWGKGHIGIQQE